MVPMLDLEDVSINGVSKGPGDFGYSKTTFSQWANEWLTDIRNDGLANGIFLTPIIYTGVSFSSTWLDSTVSESWPLWIANWNGQSSQTGQPSGVGPWQTGTSPSFYRAWSVWQYSSTAHVAGVGDGTTTNVDVDALQGDSSVLQDYVIGSTGRFSDGAHITTGVSLNAWATSAANTTNTSMPAGSTGTIISGPVYGNSFMRWRVKFDSGTLGWVAEYQTVDPNTLANIEWLTTRDATTSAVISSITSTKAAGFYPAGTLIPIQVNFNKAVTVTGTPQITLNSGAVVNYSSGSGTSTLTFNYTVAAGQNANPLDLASTSALSLIGGTIKDTATAADAYLITPDPSDPLDPSRLSWNKKIVVDTIAPTVASISSTLANGAYPAGTLVPITVTFSETVNVVGTPLLALNTGVNATYASGSGTNVLTFNYTISSGQNTPDLDYTSATALSLNGGTIKDLATNVATLTLPSPGGANSLGGNKNIVVDTIAPTVLSITSTAANGDYKAGVVIPIAISFSEAVNVSGSPSLALNSGGSAIYSSGTGTSVLTFNYTVNTGQNSAHLDYSSISALFLNGGSIKDVATNSANLALPNPGGPNSLGANKNLLIDTAAPGATFGNQAPAYSATTFDFTVSYADNLSGVDPSTVDAKDVTVTGPNSYLADSTHGLQLISYTNGVATYRIPAPGGTWDSADVGAYSISQNSNQVLDLAGNAAAAGQIASFTLPFAYVSAGILYIFPDNTGNAMILSSSNNQISISEGSTLSFDSTSLTGISVSGNGQSFPFYFFSPITLPITYSNGTFIFTADAANGALPTLVVNSDATLNFNATQHLAALTIDGQVNLPAGQAVTLVTNGLTINGPGALDLSDDAMILNYTTAAPTNLRNYLSSGRNAPAASAAPWNGSGIQSSYARDNGNGFNLAIGYADNTDLAAVRASGSYTSFGGETVSSSCVLVQLTRGADATMDGIVDGQDVAIIGTHFQKPGSGQWCFGDFDYSGTCDGSDVAVLGTSFGKTSPVLSPARFQPTQTAAATNATVASSDAAIPVAAATASPSRPSSSKFSTVPIFAASSPANAIEELRPRRRPVSHNHPLLADQFKIL